MNMNMKREREFDRNNDSMEIDRPGNSVRSLNNPNLRRRVGTSENNDVPELNLNCNDIKQKMSLEQINEHAKLYRSDDLEKCTPVDKKFEPYGVKEGVYKIHTDHAANKLKNEKFIQASDRFEPLKNETRWLNEIEEESGKIRAQVSKIDDVIQQKADELKEKAITPQERSDINVDSHDARDILWALIEDS